MEAVTKPELRMVLSSASESGAPVWSDGAFVAGVDGVYAGSAQADGSVTLEIGSGNYSFTVA